MDFDEMGRYFPAVPVANTQGLYTLFGKPGLGSFFFIVDCRLYLHGQKKEMEFVMDACVYSYPPTLEEEEQDEENLTEMLSSRVYGFLQSMDELYEVWESDEVSVISMPPHKIVLSADDTHLYVLVTPSSMTDKAAGDLLQEMVNGIQCLVGPWEVLEAQVGYTPYPKNKEAYDKDYVPARERMRAELTLRLAPLSLIMSVPADRLLSSFSMLPRYTLPGNAKRLCFLAEQLLQAASARISSNKDGTERVMRGGIVWCSSKVLYTSLPPILTRLLTAILETSSAADAFPCNMYITPAMNLALAECSATLIPSANPSIISEKSEFHVAWFSNPTDACVTCCLVKLPPSAPDPWLPNAIVYASKTLLMQLNDMVNKTQMQPLPPAPKATSASAAHNNYFVYNSALQSVRYGVRDISSDLGMHFSQASCMIHDEFAIDKESFVRDQYDMLMRESSENADILQRLSNLTVSEASRDQETDQDETFDLLQIVDHTDVAFMHHVSSLLDGDMSSQCVLRDCHGGVLGRNVFGTEYYYQIEATNRPVEWSDLDVLEVTARQGIHENTGRVFV